MEQNSILPKIKSRFLSQIPLQCHVQSGLRASRRRFQECPDKWVYKPIVVPSKSMYFRVRIAGIHSIYSDA